MSLIYSNSFSSSFAGVTTMQAKGSIVSGNDSPSGISDAISIVDGVFRSKLVDTDPTTAVGLRSELSFAPAALGDDEFLTFEVMIKDAEWDEVGSSSDRMVICQVHNEDSISAAQNLLVYIEDRTIAVWHPLTEPPSTGSNYIVRSLGNFAFDAWQKLSFRARWINASTGYLDVYFNNRRVPNASFISRGTAYNSDAPYIKIGCYAAGITGFGTRIAYYRNFAHYRGAAESFLTVLGGTPRPSAPLLF